MSARPPVPPWRRYQAEAARAARSGDREAEARARGEERALRLAERIRADVDRWPPLTAEQRDRLAALLHRAPDETVDGAA
jgi:hypothetical protein